MSRITLNKITQITGNPASAISAINNNFETLEKAIDDTLSRTGQAPTYMASALDMNSKRIINLPAPVDDNDAVRKIDIAGSSESAQQYAQQAAASAATAAVSAGEASASATSAATSASTASGVLTDAGFVAVSTDLASSDSKIKAVANNKTNIDNVATNITTVAGVGEHITDVTTVSTNMSAVTAVSGNTTNINTVATNIDNVNAVGGAIADVTSVAGDLANIDAVAGNSTNINTVATNITNINTVAGEKDNIDTIVADKTNIDAVAGNKTNIDTVAGDSTNIGKVATDITNVNTVANNIANVNTVATNISDVNTCSTNIDAIKNAPNHAANAKIWAIGDPSEPTEHSAKWWSQHAGFVNKGDYSATTTYGTNDLVKVETSTQTIFYASLQDANTGHAVTETSWWQEMWKVDKGVVEGANKDLSNLTATGEAHFVKPTDLATRDNVGLVKPDSTTITIDSEGKLTAVVTGADVDLSNLSTTGEAKFVKPDAKATTSSLGLVKPDGTSILVSDEGVIAAPLQGADKDLSNLTTTGNAKFSKVSVASTGTATDVIKYITIDGTEKKLGGDYADKDLSNLSATGESHFVKPTDKATTAALGLVKPDGSSITIDTNGVISASTQPGTPLSPTTYKKILKDSATGKVKLLWTDPDDTVVGGATLAEWAYTSIVKKQGGYPANINDGTLVIKSETKNQYASTYYEDSQTDPDDWYYKAFPVSAQEVVGLSQKNKFLQTGIFGFSINDDDPVPATRVSYLEDCDNAEYKKCYMDFANDRFEGGFWADTWLMSGIKPCGLKYDGTVDYYLSKSNFNYKEDGVTASDVSNTSYAGNFMVEFPCVYMKRVDEGSLHKVYFSQTKIDSDYECWSCKKDDGTYSNAFYFAMFEGTVVGSYMRSIATSGKPTADTTAEQEAAYATANGANWNTTLWSDEDYLQMLFPLFFKSTDSQGVLGYGATSSTTALTVNNNAALTKGWMYGTNSYSNYGMTFLGIHNFYGHRWRRCNGLMNANGTIKVKMTASTIDGSTVTGFNRTGNGYINTGYSFPTASSSYIKTLGSLGNNYGLVPKDVSGSATTYYCDGCWSNNSQLNQLLLGGSVYYPSLCGCFTFSVAALPSASYWSHGASVSYHPL